MQEKIKSNIELKILYIYLIVYIYFLLILYLYIMIIEYFQMIKNLKWLGSM